MTAEHELLEEAVKRLVRELNAKAVILSGSRARGDWAPWSDYDLLIIAEFRKEKYLDRVRKVLELLKDVPLSIEPHPYTLDEALEMLRKGNPIIVDALEEGKVLYETPEVRKLKELLTKMKEKGLRRSETTIILPATT